MNDLNAEDPASQDLDPELRNKFDDADVAPSPELRGQILDRVASEANATDPAAGYHLAQMNTARFRHPMDHPDMVGFVEMLDPMNHQADSAPGFVWRLTDEDSNDATSIQYYDDPLLLVNVSTWSDIASLRNYVYRTEHVEMVKRREEWADVMEAVWSVLWWVSAGHVPDVAEADNRLRLLRENGPTAEAFTFGKSFPSPAS